MRSVPVKIVLQSPVLLAATPPTFNLVETLPFIPGNTLRGIFARKYLETGNANDMLFQQLFLSTDVKFGFARRDGAQSIPLSARSCKYDGGFRHDTDKHGVVDLLLAGDGEIRCSYRRSPNRDVCNQAIDYFQGFWSSAHYQKVSVETRLITRTAIDPSRGTARTSQLYSQRVLEEGQTFCATVEAPDELAVHLAGLLTLPFTARLGTGTSRGQGWVTVSLGDAITLNWDPVAVRFAEFQKRDTKERRLLAVTLLSDGLFHDDYLRDTTAPSLEDLRSLGIEPVQWNAKFAKAYMDTRLVFGFDGEPLSLPRQPRLAVVAGSTFLFVAQDSISQPTLPSGQGIGWIGDNNREGYGQVVLWHPFHLWPDGKDV